MDAVGVDSVMGAGMDSMISIASKLCMLQCGAGKPKFTWDVVVWSFNFLTTRKDCVQFWVRGAGGSRMFLVA